ncbi:hypothetical protein [Sorangium sp. So ce341]|uniref:hypothetical protein n=1 Tax=Sorangium sp. So ce341 TaxID=3133302 RepID=UPI003F624932
MQIRAAATEGAEALRVDAAAEARVKKNAVLLFAPKVLDADADGRSELAIAKPSVWSSRRVGKLEAYICAGCMLVEWHVKELEGLDEHVDVSVLDGEAPRQGPYR